MLPDWKAIATLNANEFEAAAVACLEDHLEALSASQMMDETSEELFADLIARHAHARDAFPGISFDEFQKMGVAFARKGKKSAPKKSEIEHLKPIKPISRWRSKYSSVCSLRRGATARSLRQ